MGNIDDKLKALQDVEIEAEYCIDCDLYKNRNLSVAGKYSDFSLSRKPNIVIVLNNPSKSDDACGVVASGEVGRYLQKWLAQIGLTISDVSVLACTKCLVVQPSITHYQMLMCAKYLYKQINIIQPDLIIAMGRAPTHVFVQPKTSTFDILRGTRSNIDVFRSKIWPVSTPSIDGFNGINSHCVVTYHAYRLMHIFKNEPYAEEDANLVRTFLESYEH